MNVPEHVPAHLVYEFCHNTDTGLLKDPLQRFKELSDKFPDGLFYSPLLGGFWVTTNYKNYTDVALNAEVYSSKEAVIPSTNGAYRLIPINIDPPEHAKYRQVLAKQFSAPRMRKLEDNIRVLANTLIDKIIDNKSCNFVEDFAEQLPVTVFMEMMGLPLDRLDEFRGWAVIALTESDMNIRMPVLFNIIGFFTEILEERKANPQDDLISDIAQSQIDGRPVTTEEAQAYCLLLFLAGLDTVVNATSFGVRHLAGDKAMQNQLRTQPELATAFVEESLRRYSFVNIGRVVTKDHELCGQLIKEGEMILVPQICANLDDAAFEEAMDFKLDRKGSNRHVAFNTGPHNCLGAHLARIELTIIYQEWCKRIPEFSEDTSIPPVFGAGHVMGMRNLQLTW